MSTASSSPSTYFTLPSGSRMPLIGLGLWKAEQGSVADVVQTAIRLGYRHFDSAADYGNERQTGEGLQRALSSGLVKREELFITSKLWCTDHAKAHVRPAVERILADLRLSYLDLFLVHFPISLEYVPPPRATLRAGRPRATPPTPSSPPTPSAAPGRPWRSWWPPASSATSASPT